MSALQFGAQAPGHDPQTLAREILAQSRFRIRVQPAPARTWWGALRDWLGDRWNQLIDAFAHHVRLGEHASVAVGDVLLALIVALIIIVLVRLLLGMARENEFASGVAVSALEPHADSAALHAESQAAAQRGEYALAVALLYRAVLAVLDARGLLRDDLARTVNECRRDVRRRAPRLSAPFDRIARAFTAAVYAEDRVSGEQWSDAHAAYGEMTAVHADAA